WMARDAYLRHAAPEMLGGFAQLGVDRLRAQLDAQRGQATPAHLEVDGVLDGVMPEKASAAPEAEPSANSGPSTAPSASGAASEPESAPTPTSAPALIPPKGGISFLAHETTG